MRVPAMSVGKDKFDVRCAEEHVSRSSLGSLESGATLIGASEGVVKARDFKREPETGGWWITEDFDKLVGVPLEAVSRIGGRN